MRIFWSYFTVFRRARLEEKFQAFNLMLTNESRDPENGKKNEHSDKDEMKNIKFAVRVIVLGCINNQSLSGFL